MRCQGRLRLRTGVGAGEGGIVPTPFGIVVLGLIALLIVVGLAYWVRSAVRRTDRAPERTASQQPEAPWSAEQSSIFHNRGGGGSQGGFGG